MALSLADLSRGGLALGGGCLGYNPLTFEPGTVSADEVMGDADDLRYRAVAASGVGLQLRLDPYALLFVRQWCCTRATMLVEAGNVLPHFLFGLVGDVVRRPYSQ